MTDDQIPTMAEWWESTHGPLLQSYARTLHERALASDDRRFTADWMRREEEMRAGRVGERVRKMEAIASAARKAWAEKRWVRIL